MARPPPEQSGAMYVAIVGEGASSQEQKQWADGETHDTLMNFGGGLHANCGIGFR